MWEPAKKAGGQAGERATGKRQQARGTAAGWCGGGRDLELLFLAPTGRRNVATGGAPTAVAGGAQPVGAFVFQHIRPEGSEESPGIGVLSSPQKSPLPRRGEKEKKGPGPFFLIRFPRVSRRAAMRPRRSTRGYNPPPRWG